MDAFKGDLRKIANGIKYLISRPFHALRAKHALSKLSTTKAPEDIILLLDRGVGDVLYALGCLDAIRLANPGKRIVAVGVPQLHWLIDLYEGIDELELLDFSYGFGKSVSLFIHERRDLIPFAAKQGIFNTNPTVYPMCGTQDKLNGFEILRQNIFPAQDKFIPIRPPLRQTVDNRNVEDDGIISHERDGSLIEELRDTRFVILNPYSKSSNSDAVWFFFEYAAERLLCDGYSVLTNVVGDQKVVPGTMPLRCTLIGLYDLARYADFIVSIRSGVLDLLIDAGVPMFVVYGGCTTRFLDVYTLGAWQEQTECYEVLYENGAPESFLFESFDEWLSGLRRMRTDISKSW